MPLSLARTTATLRGAAGSRLHLRIVAVFLGLLLVVQAASFFAIRHGIDANVRHDIGESLRTGDTLLRRLLQQNAQQLREAARLLAADYGFRAAIAAADAATVTDALTNQADRIGASVAVFTDPRGKPVAATVADPKRVLAQLAADARLDPSTHGDTGLLVQDGQPFQMVTVPVKAPQLIGNVTMGVPFGAALIRDVNELGAQRVVFLARAAGERWSALQVGKEPPAPSEVLAAADAGTLDQATDIDGEQTALRLVPLARNDERELAAVLMRSIDDTVATYRRLQLILLAITLGGVLVFGVFGWVTARRITRPLDSLAASAERLAAGDYASPVPDAGSDEVGDLSRSFESMRKGIRERDAEIRRLAYWDTLTGLPNREQLRGVLGDRLIEARRSGEPCAVMMLDIDRFKHVNDVLGHAVGDRLLVCIAGRLSGGVKSERDTVARFGGDKFVICLPRTTLQTAVDLAHRLRHALEQPLALDDQTIDVSAGVGIAVFPDHAMDADLLLGRAELAMYGAKARQSGVSVYDAALDSASQESLSLLGELRTAIDEEQLRLYLQPKFILASGEACGAEALVRWQHPKRGLLGPDNFVPFAENTGSIRELSAWMLNRSARRCAVLRDAGHAMKIAVNLSTKDLMDLRLTDRLERTLSDSNLDPSALSLEITESSIMDDPQRALATLHRLDAMGLSLSIDDFGTGYSSLAYLKSLPLQELKIDRSFVMGMEDDRADLKIVRSTIDLAHNLGFGVVAEGVETSQTWAILKALNCDQAQGYFMAKPMPETDIDGWLGQWSRPQTRLRTEFAELL